ncbi:enterochelin esterase [Streptomyces antioxidans]|uniref:Enterochelin esterase n=1 Tax=Streptomyces antioxidans TaxID=1507734 RepID=A0A1V4D2P9_9ACTN|nr:alpha/beta hydrolase-fold protein [Streptomyces antioxidans]OPF77314.1 enterochelin esterase [Streptomyces antioxidans]
MSDATAGDEAESEIESPRLRRLLNEVRNEAGVDGGAALDHFWRELADAGAPLVEPVPDAPGERLVTVVWREDRPVAGVYVLANRVTDKHLARRGMMRRLGGTGLWHVSLRLPQGLRCSYRIHPFGPDDPRLGEDGPRSGSARGLPDDRMDPFNHQATGPFGSMIELDGAPSLADWLNPPAPAGRTDAFDFPAADGTVHRLRCFVPATDDPDAELGLLVLFDGEKWFDRYGVTRAITAATAAGRIPPMAVLGVEASADPAERMRQLGADPRFVDTLADEILPAVAARLPGRTGPRHTVLCGQSLGGLTALAAALWRPDAFGTVLAHSASTWWRPGMTARPGATAPGADSWLYEQAAAAPVGDVAIRVDVGRNEGSMVDDLRKLHTLLVSRGFDAALDVYSGGHDFCCWAAALMDGLTGTAVPRWRRRGTVRHGVSRRTGLPRRQPT